MYLFSHVPEVKPQPADNAEEKEGGKKKPPKKKHGESGAKPGQAAVIRSGLWI
jgi:hypothetical protein